MSLNQDIPKVRRISSFFAVGACVCLGAACGSGTKPPEEGKPADAVAPAARPEGSMPVSARQDALVTQTAITLSYDALGRLQWVEYPASTKRIVHSMDSAGNRTQRVIDTTITNPTPVPPTAP